MYCLFLKSVDIFKWFYLKMCFFFYLLYFISWFAFSNHKMRLFIDRVIYYIFYFGFWWNCFCQIVINKINFEKSLEIFVFDWRLKWRKIGFLLKWEGDNLEKKAKDLTMTLKIFRHLSPCWPWVTHLAVGNRGGVFV